MKKINLFLVALVGTLALTLTSCDDCKDVTCENGGTCVEGTCDCPEGFSGDACELEDKCVTNAVTCNNGGTCDDGTCDCADNYFGESCDDFCENGTYENGSCTCDAGYEGDDCETESRDKFIGSYSTNGSYTCDVSPGGTLTDETLQISTSSSSAEKMIFEMLSISLTCTVDGDNFTIEQKTSGDYTYTGSGSISGQVVSWTLNEYDSDLDETCVYTLTSTLK